MRPREDIVETDLGDELILLDPASQEMFTLNATGRTVWRTLRQTGSIEAAAQAVAGEFDVGAGAAARDVAALVQRLLAAALLVEDG